MKHRELYIYWTTLLLGRDERLRLIIADVQFSISEGFDEAMKVWEDEGGAIEGDARCSPA